MKKDEFSKKFLTTITCPECGGRMEMCMFPSYMFCGTYTTGTYTFPSKWGQHPKRD